MTTYLGVPVLVMVVCYSLIFHQVDDQSWVKKSIENLKNQMRVSRKRIEGCGALASNLQKREINFSRMLCYIFVRCYRPIRRGYIHFMQHISKSKTNIRKNS